MKCIVDGCDSTASESVKKYYFKFPSSKNLWKDWIISLQPFIKTSVNISKDRVCEKHFDSNSLKIINGKAILKPDAVPKLFQFNQMKRSDNKDKRRKVVTANVTLEKSSTSSNADSYTMKVRKSQRLSDKSTRKEIVLEEASETPVKRDLVKNRQISDSSADPTTVTTATNRIISSTPKTTVTMSTALKRANSSEATPDRPIKNAKLPMVYALTPSSTGGTVGAQQLTPITRPVTLTKLSNITTVAGTENKTIAGTGLKLMPGTVIKLAGNKKFTIPVMGANGNLNTSATRRPTIYIKAPVKKTIRTVTEELIVKSPRLHVGLSGDRLTILKNVAFQKAKIPFVDLLITLKKLRLNESFTLLAEYFEYPESEVEKIFSRTVIKLAKYLKFLIRWPDGEKYAERHKNLPITFRSKLSFVQSLIECVETEIRPEACPTLDTVDCKFFKFILAITPAGVISYVSEAFVGIHDDLAIFNACNFQSLIPKYLSLVADPGHGLTNHRNEIETDSTTDSADETEDHSISDTRLARRFGTGGGASNMNATALRSSSNLNVVNSQLTSSKVKDFSIPTLRVREPACRQQIRDVIFMLREFKILQPYAIIEPQLYQYINEILVIVSALTNFNR